MTKIEPASTIRPCLDGYVHPDFREVATTLERQVPSHLKCKPRILLLDPIPEGQPSFEGLQCPLRPRPDRQSLRRQTFFSDIRDQLPQALDQRCQGITYIGVIDDKHLRVVPAVEVIGEVAKKVHEMLWCAIVC